MNTELIKHESFTVLAGKVHVFKRDGSPYWWAGFHHQGKYIRTSTKQVDSGGAEAIASKWYFQKQSEISAGQIISTKHLFGKVAVLAIEYYRGLVTRNIRSVKTLEGIEGILKSRVTPYFEKTPVTQIDNTAWQRFKDQMLSDNPLLKRGTLHQYKNALRVVLNEAYRIGYIKVLPVFKDEYDTRKNENARPWFDSAEYSRLHNAVLNHAKKLAKIDRRQHEHALELYDYIFVATNTGMRVGELKNCKVSDVRIVKEKLTGKEILIISNIKGKRGSGTCQSHYGAVEPFRRILSRRNIKKPAKCDEPLFLIHHRVMFNVILKKTNLKTTKTIPPIKRDFVSLRATYICFRLLNGVPIYEIANNCRTSVEMIEQSYAKHLGGRLMPNINRVAQKGWDY
jgi:hypothetical protein